MKKRSIRLSFTSLASKSRILSALVRFSHAFYRKLPQSGIGHLMGGEHTPSEAGLLSHAVEQIGFRHRISLPVKRFIARLFDRSYLLGRVMEIAHTLPSLHLKCFGIASFSFGLFTTVAAIIRYLSPALTSPSEQTAIIGLLSVLVGSILTGSSKVCGEAITNSRILSFLLFRLLGIPRNAFSSQAQPFGRGNIAFIVGIAIGILGSLLSPSAVLIFLLLFSLAFAILLLPECGVVLIFLTLPFLSTMQVAALTSFVTLSWLLKLIRGKRIFATSAPDLAVLAFTVVLLFGGLVSVTPKESMKVALLMICFVFGYFLTVNLIRTTEWVRRCHGALLFSFTLTALTGIAEYLLGLSRFMWLDSSMLGIIPGRAVSFFQNPNVLAEFLVLLLPFLLAGILTSRLGDNKFGYALLAFLGIICLVFTWSRSGWLGLILAFVMLLLLCSREALAKLACLTMLVPVVFSLLPTAITQRFFSIFNLADTSIAYRLNIWRGTDKLLADHFAGGIGLGESAFRRVYPLYSLNGIEGAPHTHNLYTQLIASLGILGLFVFLALLLIFFRHCFRYLAASRDDTPRLRFATAAGLSGICGFLAMGFTDYVFYNYRIFLLFWLILGLTSATIRTAVRERIPQVLDGPSLEIECPSEYHFQKRKVR